MLYGFPSEGLQLCTPIDEDSRVNDGVEDGQDVCGSVDYVILILDEFHRIPRM